MSSKIIETSIPDFHFSKGSDGIWMHMKYQGKSNSINISLLSEDECKDSTRQLLKPFTMLCNIINEQ